MADLQAVTPVAAKRAEIVNDLEDALSKINKAKRAHGDPGFRAAAFLVLAAIEQLEGGK